MATNVPRLWLVQDLLLQTAPKFPEKPGLVYRGRTMSYAEVLAAVQKLARMLVSSGVQPGDRVAIHFEKSIEETLAMLAVPLAGGIFVNINPLQKAKQTLCILKHSGARFLFTSLARLKSLAPELHEATELTTLILTGDANKAGEFHLSGKKILSWHEHESFAPSPPDSHRRIDNEPAAIIYTSGSTGMPKGVVLSHRNIVDGAKSVSSYLHNTPEDRILSLLPFSFDYGMNQLTTSLFAGATLVLQNYLTAQDIVNALQREQITGLAGIPTIWSQLLGLHWSQEQFPTLRYITNSGGRFPEAQVREFRRRSPHTKIYLMYGLTEAFRSTYLDPDQVDIRPTSIGKAIPNAEILIVSEEGKPCRPGEVGELVHRGALVALGYWNDPEKTQERFRPNPLQAAALQIPEPVVYSGDDVKQDEEGYIYYVGRKDNMIKTSGFRVSPTEVEEAFHQTGKVQDIVALGIPDEEKGESIKVILALRPDAQMSAAELLRLVAKDMPSYMIPKEIEIREALPKSPNGKIDRAAMQKEELARRKAASE